MLWARRCLISLVCLLCVLVVEARAQEAERVQTDAEVLYAELKAQERARAGDIDFDYQLGVAANNAGRSIEAVLALQRVLDINPRHLPARAELARAYTALGEYEGARREFARVAEQSVPNKVREELNRYVQALDTRMAGGGSQVGGFLRLSTGFDSNVNNATDEERILIPAFSALGFATLDPSTLEQEDGFTEATARVSLVHGFSIDRRLFADVSGSFRKNFEQEEFDQAVVGLNLGYAKKTLENGTFTIATQGQSFWVDNDVFRYAAGVLAGWNTRTARGTDLAANLQYTYLDFTDQSARNAHRVALGGTVAKSLSSVTYAFAGLYGGREQADDRRFDNLSQWFVGARLGVETRPTQELGLFANALIEWQSFDEDEPLFLKERETLRTDLRSGARYRLSSALSLTGEVAYTRADSNITLFDYNRVTASLSVEYGF